MKETIEFRPAAKVCKWENDDWKDGRLKIELPKGSKLVGWQVYMWKNKVRLQTPIDGELGENSLTLFRSDKATWEGCVTVFYLPAPGPIAVMD